MENNIIKGSIKIDFVYDKESNVLAPTAEYDVRDEIPFEVMFRIAAAFTEHVLNQYRKIIYDTDDYDTAMEIADELRERAWKLEGDE